MKRILFIALAASLFNVIFVTDLDCEHCKKKIMENVAFEKGVKDMSVDVASKTVNITFDAAKTDTLKLGNAIRHLGYKAEVVTFGPVESKKK